MTNLNLKMKEQPQSEENLGSFYMGRMKPSTPTRRVLPRGMLTFTTIFAFAAIVWYAYPRGQERYSDIDIPVIQADKAVYKFKPDDPGGMEVLHQDSTVFNPLEKKSADTVDKVRPQPEEPMVKPQSSKASPIDKAPQNLGLQAVPHTEKIISAPEEKPTPVVKKEEVKPAEKPAAQAAKPATAPAKPVQAAKTETPKPAAIKIASAEPSKGEAVPAIESVKSEPLTPLTAPASAPAKPVATPAATKVVAAPAKPAATAAAKTIAAKPAAAPAKSAVSNPAGVFVQFGAFHDNKGAHEEWTSLQKKFPDLLKNLTMRTSVNIGPKGELTRLQAGRMTEARAKEICDKLKAGKAGCMIVRE